MSAYAILFIIRPVHDDGARGFRHQIEHPLCHFLIEGGQDRQEVLLASLLDKRLQRIDRGIGVAMIMATRIDQMNQIPRQVDPVATNSTWPASHVDTNSLSIDSRSSCCPCCQTFQNVASRVADLRRRRHRVIQPALSHQPISHSPMTLTSTRLRRRPSNSP